MAVERKNRIKIKIIISTIVAYYISAVLNSFDAISSLFSGIESALLCCVPLLILNRCKFVKSSSNSIHTLVCILVCIVSILLVPWSPFLRFEKRVADYINWSPDFTSETTSKSFRVGNLWIDHLSHSGGILSKETEWIICSLDPPKISSYDGSINVLTFSDSNSVEIKRKNGETVWIDKQHKVTFLGPVLNKEDVSLLRNQRFDEELKISSPEELLTIVNKLKAEHADSVDPPEAARH